MKREPLGLFLLPLDELAGGQGVRETPNDKVKDLVLLLVEQPVLVNGDIRAGVEEASTHRGAGVPVASVAHERFTYDMLWIVPDCCFIWENTFLRISFVKASASSDKIGSE